MRTVLATLIVLCVSVAAQAETIDLPQISENDTWTYQNTVENKTGWHQTRDESTVLRAGPTGIAITTKSVGSTMPPAQQLIGRDWSRIRSVNGRQTVVNRPLAFPLSVGKTWQVDYTEDHPNRQHDSEHFHSVYKVVGWEDVTVPAGKFHALKIEADGDWSATLAPAISNASGARVDAQGSTVVMQTNKTVATTVSGRTYKAFWYVPEVKKWVKSDEEYYGSNNVQTGRFAAELESYKVSNLFDHRE